MKFGFFFSFFLLAFFSYSQSIKGTNYFKIGSMEFNRDTPNLEVYPVYSDSTGNDPTLYAGKNDMNIAIGYHFALTDKYSIGFESRFLSSKKSSYGISAGGISFRYHFAIGQNSNLKGKNKLIFSWDDTPASKLFFVDITSLAGKLRYEDRSKTYFNTMLQFGFSMRVPLSDNHFIRHLGLELGTGASYRTVVNGGLELMPVANAGIQFYFDKNYTKWKK